MLQIQLQGLLCCIYNQPAGRSLSKLGKSFFHSLEDGCFCCPSHTAPQCKPKHTGGENQKSPFKACSLGQTKPLTEAYSEKIFSRQICLRSLGVLYSKAYRLLTGMNKKRNHFPLQKNVVIYAGFSVFKQHCCGLKQTSSQQPQRTPSTILSCLSGSCKPGIYFQQASANTIDKQMGKVTHH